MCNDELFDLLFVYGSGGVLEAIPDIVIKGTVFAIPKFPFP